MLMATLPASVLLEDLELAFTAYHKAHSGDFSYEVKPLDFNQALKELDDNFIKSEKFSGKIVISFHNPSIRDFLKEFQSECKTEIKLLISSAVFYDQFIVLWQLNEFNEKHQKIRNIIKGDICFFIDNVKKGIDYNSCRTIDTKYGNSEIHKSRWNIPLEDRAKLGLSIYEDTKTNDTHDLLNYYLLKITTVRLTY
jgi:hypothetical protein